MLEGSRLCAERTRLGYRLARGNQLLRSDHWSLGLGLEGEAAWAPVWETVLLEEQVVGGQLVNKASRKSCSVGTKAPGHGVTEGKTKGSLPWVGSTGDPITAGRAHSRELLEVPWLEAWRPLLTRGQGSGLGRAGSKKTANIIISRHLRRGRCEREEGVVGSFLLSGFKRGESRMCLSVEKPG